MKAVLLTVLTAFALAGASAQEVGRPAELEEISFLAGEFNSADTITGPDGKPVHAKSTISARWSLSRRFIRSDFSGEFPGMGKMEGMMMLTFNEKKSVFECHWFDSSTGDVMVARGKFDNGVLILESDPVEMPGMGSVQFKISYRKLEAKKVEFKLDMKMADAWANQITSIYTPKK